MKTLLLVLMSWVTLNAQSSITLVKSFRLESQELTLDTSEEVLVQQWDNEYLQVHLDISIDEIGDRDSEWVLKQLAKVGRWTLAIRDGKLVMPNRMKKIIIKGEELRESVKWTVKVPYGVSIRLIERNIQI